MIIILVNIMCMVHNVKSLFDFLQIPKNSFELNEVRVWGHLSGRHPGILQLYGALRCDGKVTIFMEYMEGKKIFSVKEF